jgi:hypothetical protein
MQSYSSTPLYTALHDAESIYDAANCGGNDGAYTISKAEEHPGYGWIRRIHLSSKCSRGIKVNLGGYSQENRRQDVLSILD